MVISGIRIALELGDEKSEHIVSLRVTSPRASKSVPTIHPVDADDGSLALVAPSAAFSVDGASTWRAGTKLASAWEALDEAG